MKMHDRKNGKSATFTNKIRSVLATGIVFLIAVAWTTPAHAQFSSGSGTTNDPYVITNVEQLQAITNYLSAHYMLGSNVNAQGWQMPLGFYPVGSSGIGKAFTGSLDGKGLVVSNLFIDRASADYIGLFGYIGPAGKVKNIGLPNATIVGRQYTGGLSGKNEGSVTESFTTGSVQGFGDYVGGLAGFNNGTISESHSENDVSGVGNYVGGFVGQNIKTVSKCSATGTVDGVIFVGGFVGANSPDGVITESYAKGDVEGEEAVGGFVGRNAYAVGQSYAWGSVTRASGSTSLDIGGFCGTNDLTISQSYSIGSVQYAGADDPTDKGFAGAVGGSSSMQQNYWDTNTSIQATTAGNATGLTTAEAQQSAFYHVDWNFTTVWTIEENTTYPYFIRDKEYTLTYVAGANGADIPPGDSPQTVKHGKSGSSVAAVPNANYHFLKWDDDSTQNPRTDTNVTNDITAIASFIRYWTVVYNTDGDGSISGVATQFVNEGSDSSAVTAVPNTGHHFVQWADASTNNPRSDTNITASVTNTAEFAINQYTLLYSAATNGSISGVTSQTVAYGSSGSEVTATPDTGYRFVEWDDGSTNNPRTDAGITNDLSFEASFELNEYTLTYTAGPNGSVSGDSPQTVAHGDDATEVTAVPDSGSRFVKWSDGSTNNTRQDLNVSGDITVEAEFIRQWTIVYGFGPNGIVSGNLHQVVDHGSDGSFVTAQPLYSHYHFLQWSDGKISNPRREKNVQSNITVNAEFEIDKYQVKYLLGPNGSMVGNAYQEVAHGSSTESVRLIPHTGFVFFEWDDGSKQNPRFDWFVTSNITVTAIFKTLMKINIIEPTTAPAYTTTNSTVALSGTFSTEEPLTNMVWQSNRGPSGNATLSGTNVWAIPNIPLFENENILTITAQNNSESTNTSLTVTYQKAVIPLIYIEQPSGAGTYSTSNTVVDLSGTLYDPTEIVTSVTWGNSAGGSGNASWNSTAGTWSASSVSLASGQNTITVTAHNSTADTSDTIVITCTPSDDPVWRRAFNDFNGDGKSDLAVFHPETGNWYIRTFAGDIIAMADNWGRPTSPVAGYRRYGDNMTYLTPGDYTGDGITDIAVFNKFSDKWYVKETITGLVVAWGLEWSGTGAIPVPGDYDGDGKTDFAIFEPSTGLWKIWTWRGDGFNIPFGWSEAIPVPGDYDGDGITDFAVYHPESGNWYIWTWGGAYYITQFGWSETEPVPADYNGDGKTDLAVYHQASGTWHIITSAGYQHIQFGWSETVPVPGDYNGDGKTDLAVYHQNTGTWYIWTWGGDFKTIQWGWSETVPVRAGW